MVIMKPVDLHCKAIEREVTSMGKLVLVIAVVFCLDLAFILFIRNGGDLVELAQAINVRSVDTVLISQEMELPEGTARKNPNEDIYDVQVPKADSISSEVNFRRAIPRRIQANKSVQIRKARNQPLRSYALKEPAEPFTDTVILIARANYTSYGHSERVQNPSSKITKTHVTNFTPIKRSFFSRARPVVRKPYDWLRAIATNFF